MKRVLRQCMSCRIRFSRVAEQVMANLPEARVLPGEFPFASVGIDYFGPILTRINRSVVKRYGCLFSCMKTRAVHIEVASSLTVDSFIMALMRFISRRGKPIEIFSDNGTNFVGAEIELRKLIASWNQTRLSNEMLQRNIEWNFNPPSASHRGGVWERIIRSVRRILCSVSKEQILSDEVLYTYLTEVERILNDRPLVPVYDDSNVIDVLTPNKLLLLRSSEGLVEGEVDMRSRYTRQWRRSQHLARTFWKRWMTEYIPTLQQRSKWLTTKRDLRIGDLVLIIDGNPDWHCWPKGIVSDVIHNVDGHVRQVLVRTSNGNVHRDIRKVALLEGVDENCSL